MKYAPSPLLLCTVLARDSVCESGLSTFGQGDTGLERSCPQGYHIITTSFQHCKIGWFQRTTLLIYRRANLNGSKYSCGRALILTRGSSNIFWQNFSLINIQHSTEQGVPILQYMSETPLLDGGFSRYYIGDFLFPGATLLVLSEFWEGVPEVDLPLRIVSFSSPSGKKGQRKNLLGATCGKPVMIKFPSSFPPVEPSGCQEDTWRV